jgi:hypothetical protein
MREDCLDWDLWRQSEVGYAIRRHQMDELIDCNRHTRSVGADQPSRTPGDQFENRILGRRLAVA